MNTEFPDEMKILIVCGMTLLKIFLEQRPVVFVPALGQMIVQTFGKTDVVENDMGSGAIWSQLEPSDGPCAFGPRHHSPTLYDSLVWHELEVSADDMSFEQGERSADLAVDLGCPAGERNELFRLQQRFVNFLRAGVQIDLLMDRYRLVVLRDDGDCED